MHELSLAMSVSSIVERQMVQYPEATLSALEIEVGLQSGVDIPSFKTAIESVLRTSPWPTAAAELIIIPAKFQCLDCEAQFETARNEVADFYPACPKCGSRRTLPVAGRNFRLRAIRLAT